ncbi:MAG: hypothetical protein AseanaTS_23580 [Candidatus Pelagadaptatus aseana]|uniref:DUF7931 domain-containing protein n=1 Tax=Candidatus Pelagadaptatus aseana TaxID=3120508 RepID=UPI0039B1D6D1
METPSESCATLTLLEGLESFQKYLQLITGKSVKELDLLFDQLDLNLFNDPAFIDNLSHMVRQHPKARVRILLKNTRNITSQRCLLLDIAKRLPSKINIRRATHPPQDNAINYVIADRDSLLLRHDRDSYQGFFNSSARPEAQNLLEEFNTLWERQSTDIPDLMNFRL